MAEPLDYSKTQRVVLLIDLHPLFTLQNPNLYATTILAAAKRFLTFSHLSASLFALKFFFSSLSPLRSSSAIHRLFPESSPSLTSLSFNHPSQTLQILSKTLGSLSSNASFSSDDLESSSPRGSHTCSALLQLMHDYAWESGTEISNNDFPYIHSNLVVMFSPICKLLYSLSEYMNVDLNSESLKNADHLLLKFRDLFSVVNDAFITRGIHFSWVDVNCQLEDVDDKVKENALGSKLGFFEKGIRSFNWGYSTSDAIVLGSALIPFDLVYPKIGIPWNFLNSDNMPMKRSVQLRLQISDVSGKPLECKCCDLEFLNLRASPSIRSDSLLNASESIDSQREEVRGGESFFSHFRDGMKKLHIKAVYRYDEGKKIEGCSSNYILVRQCSEKSEKRKTKCSEKLFADKVLEILSNEPGKISQENSEPIWQIVLSFLHREGYWALVSIADENADIATGILKAFTADLALLSIVDNGHIQVRDCSVSDPTRKSTSCDDCYDISNPDRFIASQTDTSTSGNCEPSGYGKRRKSKKHLNQDLTWSFYCNAALECSSFDLFDFYFARQLNKSKKLKFLKCWMKQIRKYKQESLSELQACKSKQEQLMCPSFPSEQSQMTEEVMSLSFNETSKSFFSNLLRQIQHGVESKMDLQMLAARLVKSSIYWVSQICETDKNLRINDSCSETAFAKLTKLLLKEPKEMKQTREQNDSSKDPVSQTIVREYPFNLGS